MLKHDNHLLTVECFLQPWLLGPSTQRWLRIRFLCFRRRWRGIQTGIDHGGWEDNWDRSNFVSRHSSDTYRTWFSDGLVWSQLWSWVLQSRNRLSSLFSLLQDSRKVFVPEDFEPSATIPNWKIGCLPRLACWGSLYRALETRCPCRFISFGCRGRYQDVWRSLWCRQSRSPGRLDHGQRASCSR